MIGKEGGVPSCQTTPLPQAAGLDCIFAEFFVDLNSIPVG